MLIREAECSRWAQEPDVTQDRRGGPKFRFILRCTYGILVVLLWYDSSNHRRDRLIPMRRRAVLKIAGSVTALFGGFHYFMNSRTPRNVNEVTFGKREVDRNMDRRTTEGPEIDISHEEKKVTISGVFVVGDSCAEAKLDSINYRDSEDEIIAIIEGHVPLKQRWMGQCLDYEQVNEYTLIFTVDSLPSKITGIERDHKGREYRTSIDPAESQD